MRFDEWEQAAPEALRDDATWKTQAFRLASYLADRAVADARQLDGQPGMTLLAGQLVHAAGSIAANIAEGYSRRSPPDRAKFYEYALGSAREARSWYLQARSTLGGDTFGLRDGVLSQVIRLLLTMIRNERTDPDSWNRRAQRR